jgi:hypothetical protein
MYDQPSQIEELPMRPFWKFGVLVPRNHAQAVDLDKQNGKIGTPSGKMLKG